MWEGYASPANCDRLLWLVTAIRALDSLSVWEKEGLVKPKQEGLKPSPEPVVRGMISVAIVFSMSRAVLTGKGSETYWESL